MNGACVMTQSRPYFSASGIITELSLSAHLRKDKIDVAPPDQRRENGVGALVRNYVVLENEHRLQGVVKVPLLETVRNAADQRPLVLGLEPRAQLYALVFRSLWVRLGRGRKGFGEGLAEEERHSGNAVSYHRLQVLID